jgi:hypothetical protein
MKKILIIAVNPRGTPALRLDQEIRDIKEAIRQSRYRNDFGVSAMLLQKN